MFNFWLTLFQFFTFFSIIYSILRLRWCITKETSSPASWFTHIFVVLARICTILRRGCWNSLIVYILEKATNLLDWASISFTCFSLFLLKGSELSTWTIFRRIITESSTLPYNLLFWFSDNFVIVTFFFLRVVQEFTFKVICLPALHNPLSMIKIVCSKFRRLLSKRRLV